VNSEVIGHKTAKTGTRVLAGNWVAKSCCYKAVVQQANAVWGSLIWYFQLTDESISVVVLDPDGTLCRITLGLVQERW